MMMTMMLLPSFLRDKIFFQTNVHTHSLELFFRSFNIENETEGQPDIISALILSLSVGIPFLVDGGGGGIRIRCCAI
jgi:hypothetical protein